MKEDKEIHRSFKMKKGMFDDDYYFYESGKIVHFYDKSQKQANIEVEVTADEIPDNRKIEILEKCPEELKERIKEMLYPNQD